ncbi:hypothetical protein AB0D32_12555 [Micromonospora sp. NPDC048170]|uniref:hypothetical protein n=1 Tax=Micromonospora sp. NPDC048170 TaxID=3154819 RepID=UPI0033FE244D
MLDAYVRQILIRTFLDGRRRGWWRRERVGGDDAERPAPPDSPENRLVMLQALAAASRGLDMLRGLLSPTHSGNREGKTMNEDDLRETLRSEMATSTPPPPMATTATLRTARRARSRRRTLWACAGSAATILAVAGAATMFTPDAGGHSPAGPAPQAAPPPSSKDTAQPWPTGPDGHPQEDRTARAGSRYDQGIRLLDEIISVVPAGYTAPENPANQPTDQVPLRMHQAQFEDKVNGVDVWGYMSSAALAKGERMGSLLVEVHTAGNQLPAEPCALQILKGQVDPPWPGVSA